jgi:hypothetical protein
MAVLPRRLLPNEDLSVRQPGGRRQPGADLLAAGGRGPSRLNKARVQRKQGVVAYVMLCTVSLENAAPHPLYTPPTAPSFAEHPGPSACRRIKDEATQDRDSLLQYTMLSDIPHHTMLY